MKLKSVFLFLLAGCCLVACGESQLPAYLHTSVVINTPLPTQTQEPAPTPTEQIVVPRETPTIVSAWPTGQVIEPQPLDLSDPDSIVFWLAYDLATGSTEHFNQIIVDGSLLYGTGLAGGREPVSKADFMAELNQRITSRPACAGYTSQDREISIMLWTTGWSPAWVANGPASSDEIVFSFNLIQGQIFTTAYFTPSSAILEVVDHLPCFDFGQTAPAGDSSVNSASFARITGEVVEVNLRQSPGYVNKNDYLDVVAKIPAGALVEIIGGPQPQDGLNWWYVSWNGYAGWLADHTSSGREILDFHPR